MHFKFSDDSLARQAKVEAFFRERVLPRIRNWNTHMVRGGWCGQPMADIDALADAPVALSRFAAAEGGRLEYRYQSVCGSAAGKGAMALAAVLVVNN